MLTVPETFEGTNNAAEVAGMNRPPMDEDDARMSQAGRTPRRRQRQNRTDVVGPQRQVVLRRRLEHERIGGMGQRAAAPLEDALDADVRPPGRDLRGDDG